MTPHRFVDALRQVSLHSVFNPYRDTCASHDHSESARVRRMNLEIYMEAAISTGIDSLWLGRDCGYRGARRTGIALTDERHLTSLADHLGIRGLCKATTTEVVVERTATEVWKMIRELKVRMFLWNVFPFHPHSAGNPMSNRPHSAAEFRQSEKLLEELLGWLQPRVVVTLGNDAARDLTRLGVKSTLVRHPSYGGHLDFARALRDLYASQFKAEPYSSTIS